MYGVRSELDRATAAGVCLRRDTATNQRYSVALHFFAWPLWHRRFRAVCLRIRRLPPRRRTKAVAGAATESHRIRRFPLPMLLRFCRQPAVAQSGAPAGSGTAPGIGPGSGAAVSRGLCRLWSGDSVQEAGFAPGGAGFLCRCVARGSRGLRPFLRKRQSLARRLRAFHGSEGRTPRNGLDHMGCGDSPPRTARRQRVDAPARAPVERHQVLAIRVFPPVARPQDLLPAARHPLDGRHPHLRRARQCGRLGPPGALLSRRSGQSDRGFRRAAGLLQRHRAALGQSDLSLGCAGGRRVTGGGSSAFRASLALFDLVRLDHFRGFESYWEVPATEATAIHGRWVKGAGRQTSVGASERIWRTADCGREPGSDHAAGRATAREVRPSGNEHLAVCVRHRSAGTVFSSRTITTAIWSPTPAATTTTRRRLVVEFGRGRQHPHAGGCSQRA